MHRGYLAIRLVAGAIKTNRIIRWVHPLGPEADLGAVFPLKQMPCKLLKHQSVTSRREMIVAENEKMFVPVLVCVSRGEEDRKQVDERLAPALAEPAPERHLPAVAVALRQLLRPGIYHDRQWNISSCQQIGEGPHVLQGSCDAALNAKRLIGATDVQAWRCPADAAVIGIERPSSVAEQRLNRSLDVNTHPV